MKKNTTKKAFEKLDAQNFKVVDSNETKDLQGGWCYCYPTCYYAYVRTSYGYCADQERVVVGD